MEEAASKFGVGVHLTLTLMGLTPLQCVKFPALLGIQKPSMKSLGQPQPVVQLLSVLIELRVVASASLILMDILKERGLYKDLTQLCIRMTAEVGVHLSFLPPSGSLSFPSFPPPTSFLPS